MRLFLSKVGQTYCWAADERRRGSPKGTGRRGGMNLMGNRKAIAGLAALALGVASLSAAARAQEAQQGTGQPARAVRLSFVDGQVKLAQGNQVLATQAVANTPLFEGMQLTTSDNGKAEIQFEDGSVVRIAPDSMLTLQVLRGAGTGADAELTLNSGLCYFEFQGGGQADQMSVHFGTSVATTSGFTALRIAMDTPPGSLAVFSGNVHLRGRHFSHGYRRCRNRPPRRRKYHAQRGGPEPVHRCRIHRAQLLGCVELRPRPDTDGRGGKSDGSARESG